MEIIKTETEYVDQTEEIYYVLFSWEDVEKAGFAY
ncbi:MAG: hypothetical protein KatS3mg104_2972 [Phycisphaerae bacterium]|nr:MAG: hypothetical protein KatS3mg104_2972 [Phycisphaerae bacterium]